MTLKIGDKLPDFSFGTPSIEGPTKISSGELFDGKKAVLFGVPGAFTPTCHANHLPGYVEQSDALKAAGVEQIAVVAVNDVFVMQAWQDASKGADDIAFLADGSADFAKQTGLELDLGEFGLGTRIQRFSMLLEDGVIQAINFESNPGAADETGADAMLKILQA